MTKPLLQNFDSHPLRSCGTQLTTQPITSHRLRREVGSRAQRGQASCSTCGAVQSTRCPSPRPSPPKRGDGCRTGSVPSISLAAYLRICATWTCGIARSVLAGGQSPPASAYRRGCSLSGKRTRPRHRDRYIVSTQHHRDCEIASGKIATAVVVSMGFNLEICRP
jgi:hypothetical protein